MNIGRAATLSGVSAKTIRYYEEVGLIFPAARTESGYRQYEHTDIQILKFIARSRSLGFSVDDVSKLLSLWSNKGRQSASVKALAERHIQTIEKKVYELETMRDALRHLVERCHGDKRPDCPIIDGLANA
jgi:Cu(I)-responsive transcriptional regulator